ncbi:MAG: hypothetical protein NVS3B10_17950 [Polyangiales bacterium]
MGAARRVRFVRLVSLALVLVLLSTVAIEGVALADRRSETAAKDALKRADDDYLQTDFAKGLRRLQTAERLCGEASCTAATHAALLRDIGTMQFRLGQLDAATSSFRRAKKLDPAIALNPDYDAKDLREAFEAATAAAPPPVPGGDFTHRPAAAEAAETPLPVYVEIEASDALASVVVKYRNDSMRSFRRAVLKRVGKGWGGYVPCADVVPGNVRYYIQGFDKDGELVASSGDPNHTIVVPIKQSVSELPSLPGVAPLAKCGEQDVQELNLDEGERCQEDRQCKSGACSSGRCKAVQPFEQEESAGGERRLARFWIGVAGSLDLGFPSAKSDVCAQSGGISTSGFWCTTPEGADFPAQGQNANALVPGHAGTPSSELTPGGVHITVTIDYAASANLMLGVRFGYVANAYPGSAASAAGKTLSTALHAEARGTYVFGDDPLARSGLAPYAFVAAGVARFDMPTTVMVEQQGIAGERAVRAWHVAGPAFGALGGGARYAFSPRVAFATGLGIDVALGPSASGVTVAPEMNLQYGF